MRRDKQTSPFYVNQSYIKLFSIFYKSKLRKLRMDYPEQKRINAFKEWTKTDRCMW